MIAFARRALPARGRPALPLLALAIVRAPPDQAGFADHLRRWVDERFSAGFRRNRGFWQDPGATCASPRTFPHAAAGTILL